MVPEAVWLLVVGAWEVDQEVDRLRGHPGTHLKRSGFDLKRSLCDSFSKSLKTLDRTKSKKIAIPN